MRAVSKHIFITILIVLCVFQSFSQIKNIGIPYILNYSKDIYKGEKQNFAITQDKRGIMFFANQGGIIEYDGANWRMIYTPNKSTVRSFATDSLGRIYVGAIGDFGYLKVNKKGEMQYVSLLPKLPHAFRGNVKDILYIGITDKEGICFRSESYLYILKNNKDSIHVISVDKISTDASFLRSFNYEGKFYVHTKYVGLQVLKDGDLQTIPGSEQIEKKMIRIMLPYQKNKALVITFFDGCYVFDGKTFTKIKTPIDKLIDREIYEAIPLKNGYYAFGTFTSGLFITDKDLNPIQIINTSRYLQDNQVEKLFQDNFDNLWVALNNGLSYILISSPFTRFNEQYGLTGSTLTSLFLKDKLYIGNSYGVYYRDWTKSDYELGNQMNFVEIKNHKGLQKSFLLDTVGSSIYCANNIGLSKIENNAFSYIFENKTARTFLRLEKNPNYMIAGGDNLKSFVYKDKKWTFAKLVDNFDMYCRYMAEDEEGYLWVSHNQKGLFKLRLNNFADSVVNIEAFDSISGLKGLPSDKENYLFKINNKITITTVNGIYVYDNKTNQFKEWEELNGQLTDYKKTNFVIQDKQGNIWIKQEGIDKKKEIIYELGVFIKQKDGSYLFNKKPFYPFRNEIYSFNQIDKDNYIIGAEKGFVHYDRSIPKDYTKSYHSFIRRVELNYNDSVIFGGTHTDTSGLAMIKQDDSEILKIDYKYHSLKFYFGAAFYEYPEKTKYKYFLENSDIAWSDWRSDAWKEYSNLGDGKYILHIKAKNIYELESEEATYEFIIKPPWYRTPLAIAFYLLAVVFVIWGIVRLSIRRLRLANERLEQIVKERTATITQKNSELSKKNEEIEAQRDMLFSQNEEIKEKNKNITSSITYAKRIQEAMLPFAERISQSVPEFFILFRPRDIVSGDFYWFAERDKHIIFTAVDCTGHGVPGAFMSMIGNQILTTIISEGTTEAGQILDLMNQYVRTSLKQDRTDNQDGMDMALCVIDKERNIVEFAGAKNPLVYIKNGELTQLGADKQAIGGHQITGWKGFTQHEIVIDAPTYFYVFSDGYPDQFGGPQKRKFMIKKFKEMLLEIHQKPMDEQRVFLNNTIEAWIGPDEQTDDILVIGFKIEPFK